MIALFLTFLGYPKVFDSKLQQTNTKTDENKMPFPIYFPTLLSCETMIHHLRFRGKKKYKLYYIYILLW